MRCHLLVTFCADRGVGCGRAEASAGMCAGLRRGNGRHQDAVCDAVRTWESCGRDVVGVAVVTRERSLVSVFRTMFLKLRTAQAGRWG